MASVNKITIIGNLAKDPTVRYSGSGSAIANMTVATNRHWKDRKTGEKQEETEFHRVVLYDRLAEIAGEYLKKGSSCYIEGRLRTRKWQDRDGQDRYTTETIAESLQLLGSRQEPPQQAQNQPNQYEQKSGGRAPQQPSSSGFDDMDDDLPPF